MRLKEEGVGGLLSDFLSGSLWSLTMDGIYVTGLGHRASGLLCDPITPFQAIYALSRPEDSFSNSYEQRILSFFFLSEKNEKRLASFSLASRVRSTPTQDVG